MERERKRARARVRRSGASGLILLAVVAAMSCSRPSAPPSSPNPGMAEARDLVARANEVVKTLGEEVGLAEWERWTNATPATEAAAATAQARYTAAIGLLVREARRLDRPGLDPDIRRQLRLLSRQVHLPSPDDPGAAKELAAIREQLLAHYASRVCVGDVCKEAQEISSLLRDSRDPRELLRWWTAWHDAADGMAAPYERLVLLANRGARDQGYGDVGQLWRSWYDVTPDELAADVARLWHDVEPLYLKLHCHVRARLAETYPGEGIRRDGPIPAHLVGNLWAQDWRGLAPLLGLPLGRSVDVTRAIVDRGIEAVTMVRIAEGFYTSLGFAPLPKTFWERSMFTRPQGREVICQPAVHDLAQGRDPRLSMCVRPIERDLIDLHHELGHVYYNVATERLPPLYRDSPHDGFHEAVGDALTLSMTPAYRKRVGLEPAGPAEDEAARLDRLMTVALEKLPYLGFAVMLDEWRWKVFSGELPRAQWNSAYWALRARYQGIAPPVARGDEHFDAGAKFHVASSHPYLRYFLALILQFQIHAALCEAAGQGDQLDQCSIYANPAAGARLRAFLALGATRPWPDALETLTGTRRMDATALVRYFGPVSRWLDEQNRGRACGW